MSARPPELDATTIATIYSSPLAEAPWADFVELACDRLGAMVMTLSFQLIKDGGTMVGVQAFRGPARQVWKAFLKDYSATPTFDFDSMATGRIYALAEFLGPDNAMYSRLRRDVLDPAGVGESYCLALGGPEGGAAFLVWSKPAGKPLTPDERAFCKAITPHLNIAIAGYQRMGQAEIVGKLAGDALGNLSIGVAALDRMDQIVFANRVAQDIIAASPDLGIHQGRLTAVSPSLAIKLNASRISSEVARIRGRRDEPVGMLMSPIGGKDELGPRSRPERALYFHQHSTETAISARLVAELFGLSLSEARLAILLAGGLTLREAAEHLGNTESTVRTYSKIIFSKLGVRRQADLVRLVLRSVAIFAGPDETEP